MKNRESKTTIKDEGTQKLRWERTKGSVERPIRKINREGSKTEDTNRDS